MNPGCQFLVLCGNFRRVFTISLATRPSEKLKMSVFLIAPFAVCFHNSMATGPGHKPRRSVFSFRPYVHTDVNAYDINRYTCQM